ncbi:hypothetical protein NCCP1664_08950 [Zafaria cholistanensis]|uniref:Uncharacterized protein n=1 Tax=Zafaria cholistanensis TaxID=1682741 RepID=A0A5A7NRF4_9MICC|nr:hypothetical protein [Zafaria cholistanensis]GER22398.1 hypothetical protein NCCP1664_08950 [Zafaria cholistanensis]
MAERGSDKHGSELDDQMKHEVDGALKGVQPAHREEFRQSEPFPDDTDPEEVQDALEREDLASDRPPAQED